MGLILGLITGFLFGFALQKAQVIRFEKQVGAFLFKDMSLYKFILSAIAVAVMGIALLHQFGLISYHVKPVHLAAQIIGGLIFGAGWAIAGYCPSTAISSLAEGRIAVIWPISGMLAGVFLFGELYPWIRRTIIPMGDYGRVTLATLLGIQPLLAALLLTGALVGCLFLIQKLFPSDA